MSKNSWAVTFNSPVVLSFSIAAVVVQLLGSGVKPFFVSHPDMHGFVDHLSLVTWVLGHGDWNHLFGNLTMILLLGPILEERHKSLGLLAMIFICSLVGGLFNSYVLRGAVLGASGIVFMFIILASTTNIKRREIPLTFIAVAVLFMGKEVIMGLKADNISQAAHLIGGIVGASFGFFRANVAD